MRFKLTALLLLIGIGFSQASELPPLRFRGGDVKTQSTSAAQLTSHWQAIPAFEGRKYFLLRFQDFLSQAQYDALRESGLVFEAYIPEKAYFASAPAGWSVQQLANKGILSLQAIPAIAKFDEALVKADAFRPLERQGRQVLVSILPFNGIPLETLNLSLWREIRFQPTKNRYSDHLVSAWVDERDLQKLAAHPAVQFIEPAAPLGEPEDREGRSLHRSHTIDNLMSGGRRYSGQGVVMGIADDGAIGPHIDFKGRLTQYTTNFAAGNTHGDMVAGIALGAANLNPNMMGMAPGTYLHMYGISGYPHVVTAPANYTALGTTITSTSYSQGNGGIYTADAATIDDQIRNNTMLMHVFSAGNAGTSDHGYGAGAGWGNITGGYKAAKNVMAVANLRNTDQLENSSSRGPARDGRIKPDIAANGFNQMSTGPNNTYLVGGGTSAASPGIAGIYAQLSHAYRALNNDSVPPSALIKAVMLNTAEDLGNPGPDFRFGWGRVNALRAVQTLELNRYFSGVISQGDSLVHQIDVPSNVKQLRVMVYWADKAGAANATRALVNNLNMRLQGPDTLLLPWVLNPTPTVAALNSPAVRGIDSLNNVEQVTINNPSPGNYTVQVLGSAVPVGPQRYWVVYEWYTEQIVVTYPMGGEGFVPGEVELIRWDATGVSGTFNVQFSTNNGTSWTNIATNLANTVRHVSWTVPQGISGQVLVRVTNGTITGQSEQTFSISPLVTNVAFSYICTNDAGLSWNPVNGATGYIVYRLGQRYMDSVGTTTATNFIITGTTPSDTEYFAVAPIGANNLRGRRTIAIMKPLNTTFGCQARPAAGFQASVTSACVNQTITLVDQSLNLATSWRWSISPAGFTYVNGTSDTSQAPQVQFQANGSYTVQLIASNTFGSDTLVRPNHVIVGNGLTLPQLQNFAGNALPSNWGLVNPDNASTWQFRTGSGPAGTSTGMAWINFFSYNAAGQIDELISPVIDLTTGVSSPLLTFDVAYAQYSTTLFDGLRIEISSDCGITYAPSTYFKQGAQLATAGTLTSAFTPSLASHWRTDSLDLSSFVGNRIRIKFVGINGYGNNLYLTNFRVNSGTGIVAGFNIGGNACLGGTLTFESTSTGSITTQTWSFGTGATPPTATGAGPHNVQYSTAGSRNVVLTVNGPNGTQQAILPAVVAAEPISDFSFTASGAQVSFTNQSQHGVSYRWEFGDGNTSNLMNPAHTYAVSNVYEVRLITTNPCSSDTITKTVQAFATSVKEVGGLQARLYPNPAAGHTQLDLAGLRSGQPLQLSLLDLQGRVLWQETVAVADERLLQNIGLQGFAAGLYQLRVVQADRAMQLPLLKSE
jgi:PKD repeat protein